MVKIKDFFCAGAVLGLINGLIYNLFVFILKLLHVNTRTPWGDSTALFFNPPEIYMLSAQILGFMLSLIIPALIGVALCFLVKFTGKDYIYVKSIALSMFTTFLHFGVIFPSMGLHFLKHSISTNYAAFLGMVLFGVILGYSVKKFTDF